MMSFTIRELEHKNGELRERLKAMQQLREALGRAQERLEDGEALAREAHAARAEAARLADTVRGLEGRLKGADADKEAALQGLRFEIQRCKDEARQAQVPLALLAYVPLSCQLIVWVVYGVFTPRLAEMNSACWMRGYRVHMASEGSSAPTAPCFFFVTGGYRWPQV